MAAKQAKIALIESQSRPFEHASTVQQQEFAAAVVSHVVDVRLGHSDASTQRRDAQKQGPTMQPRADYPV